MYIWGLPNNSHRAIVLGLSNSPPLLNILCLCFITMYSTMSQVDNKLLNFLAIRAKSVSNGVLGSNLRFLENIVKECDNVTKDLKYYLNQVEFPYY